jgi:acetyl esterase/lipase
MPYGYLLTVLLWGAVTAAMLRPPHRPLPLARAVYFLSVALNELPWLALLLLGVATADALLSSRLHTSAVGIIALVLAALTALGMLRLQRQVLRARGVVAGTIGLPAAAQGFRWERLQPLPLRPRGVQRIADLSYGRGGREHRLDLYRRRDLEAPAPVLLFFHGGGYSGGGKHFEGRHLWYRMARRGWVVLSADYGLRPHVSWPEHLIDAKRVIAWVHQNAGAYGMDPRRIVSSGSSAGAHLSVHCALSANDPRLQPGFEEVDTRLAAAVLLYGYFGRYYCRDRDEEPTSHPLDLPTEAAPPIVMLHGDRDSYVPVQQARDLAAHLRGGSSRTVAYAELPGAQHGFDVFASPRFRAAVDGIEHFLEQEVRSPASPDRRAAP